MRFYFLFSLIFCFTQLSAYESMHEKTPVGKIVVIDLPARTALKLQLIQVALNLTTDYSGNFFNIFPQIMYP